MFKVEERHFNLADFSGLNSSEQRERLFQDRKIIKAIIRITLDDIRSWDKHFICASSNKEKRKRAVLHIGGIFRDPKQSEQSGIRNMTVGKKELMLEFRPGEKPPSLLQLRVIGGELVDEEKIAMMSRIFLEIKNMGVFEESYLQAIRQILTRFINDF